MEGLLRYRWLIFGIVALAYFLVYFHRTSVVGLDITVTFPVDAYSIALLESIYFFVYTVMQLPRGILVTDGVRRTR